MFLTAVPLVELSLLLENMSHHQSEMEPRLEMQCQTAVQEVRKFFFKLFILVDPSRILTQLLTMTKNDAEKLLTNEEIYLGKSRAPYVDIREYIYCPLHGLPVLFWLSTYVTSHC